MRELKLVPDLNQPDVHRPHAPGISKLKLLGTSCFLSVEDEREEPLLLLMAGGGDRAFGLNPYLVIIPANRGESEGGPLARTLPATVATVGSGRAARGRDHGWCVRVH
jgi:hypothetical protein